MTPKLPKSKAWEFEFWLSHRLSETGKEVPFKDATVRAWFSDSLGGDPINEESVLTLVERDNRPGCYFGVLALATLAADLSSYNEGDTVYEVCERNGEIDSRPLQVTLVNIMASPTNR
jgi:hypothetical protein